MKGNAVYKRSYNGCLAICGTLGLGDEMPSENEISQSLSVSRTTIRAVMAGLEAAAILTRDSGARRLARFPEAADAFPDTQTVSTSATVERRFLEWILQGHIGPGHLLTAAELARQFGTSTTIIREHLPHFQHFGLIERRPNSAWLFKGVTPAFAHEIYEVREMFELRAARSFIDLPDESLPWQRMRAIEAEHRALLMEIDKGYALFPDLDERLHRTVHETADNRFIKDFYDIISMLFHYNAQWDAEDEKQRTFTALTEHLAYIEALLRRDLKAMDRACRQHLKTARGNLLRSIDARTKTPRR
ncbi:GntR family transcriptional regulator [Rhizobium sp. Leaf384]|nr:GntR family transcriptional regulator [Rhizobium sp. Leaf383]KQS78770.1 GntR family transcriptional regulator [Rhizobium sp. Leaf384]